MCIYLMDAHNASKWRIYFELYRKIAGWALRCYWDASENYIVEVGSKLYFVIAAK